MTDEDRLGKSGTGVAHGGADATKVIRPERMIWRGTVQPATVTLLLEPDDAAPESGTAIPLESWLAHHQRGHELRDVGVILSGADDPSPLRPHLDQVPLVALRYPVFSDGRAYSHAYRIRKTWGFSGPILAFGDVLRDQLFYMHRVGIDAFYMRVDQNLEESLAAFSLYSDFYQYNDLQRVSQPLT